MEESVQTEDIGHHDHQRQRAFLDDPDDRCALGLIYRVIILIVAAGGREGEHDNKAEEDLEDLEELEVDEDDREGPKPEEIEEVVVAGEPTSLDRIFVGFIVEDFSHIFFFLVSSFSLMNLSLLTSLCMKMSSITKAVRLSEARMNPRVLRGVFGLVG